MPDASAPPEPSTTIRKSSRASTTASSDESRTDAQRRAHFVLQGKGGVGKTWIASLLAQYYQENNRPIVCYDTDPVNASLAAIPALNAKRVKLFNGDQVAVTEIDQLMADILSEPSDVVVDNGAASFAPFSQYLIENDISTVLAEHGVQMVLHTVIAGGGMAMDTLSGLVSILDHYQPPTKIVVWINEYFGPVVVEGRELEQLPIYQENTERIAGIVRLNALNPVSFGHNLKDMIERKMTFAEALSSSTFTVIPMQRLVMIRRGIWQQLAPVLA